MPALLHVLPRRAQTRKLDHHQQAAWLLLEKPGFANGIVYAAGHAQGDRLIKIAVAQAPRLCELSSFEVCKSKIWKSKIKNRSVSHFLHLRPRQSTGGDGARGGIARHGATHDAV